MDGKKLYKGCVEAYGGEELLALFKALQPESAGSRRYRSRIIVTYEPGRVRVCIESERLSSFRAALNTFLRLFSMIVDFEILN